MKVGYVTFVMNRPPILNYSGSVLNSAKDMYSLHQCNPNAPKDKYIGTWAEAPIHTLAASVLPPGECL